MSAVIPAYMLGYRHLGRLIEVSDYQGTKHAGRLDRIEIDADPTARIILWIATQEPINESDGGGTYWSTFLCQRYIDRAALVKVGDFPTEAAASKAAS